VAVGVVSGVAFAAGPLFVVAVSVPDSATWSVTLPPLAIFVPGLGVCATTVPGGLGETTRVVATLRPSAVRLARAWGRSSPLKPGTDGCVDDV
jgi:hypothetical protein